MAENNLKTRRKNFVVLSRISFLYKAYVPPVLVAGIAQVSLGCHLCDIADDAAVRACSTLTLHTYNNHTVHVHKSNTIYDLLLSLSNF